MDPFRVNSLCWWPSSHVVSRVYWPAIGSSLVSPVRWAYRYFVSKESRACGHPLGDLVGGIPPARSFELGAAALPLCLVQSPPEKVGAAASGGLPQIPSDPCLQLSLPVGAGEDEDDPYRCDNDAGDVEIDGILGAENEAGEKDAASEERESIAFVKDGASTAFIVIVAVAITVAGGFQRRVIILHLDELDHLVFLLVGEDPHVAGEDVINAWMIRSQEEARF